MISTFDRIAASVSKAVGELHEPTPEFHLVIGWANDYNALFSSDFRSESSETELLRIVTGSSRTLIAGRGGGAKTALMGRLAKSALANGVLPVLVSLRDWVPDDYRHWKNLAATADRVWFLLSRFGTAGPQFPDLDLLPPHHKRLILLDGVNEVDATSGQQMIYAMDEYARFAVNTSIVVSDRLARRDFFNPARWTLGIVEPLSPSEVRRVLKRDRRSKYDAASPDIRQLLATPYFLDAFIKNGNLAGSTSDVMRQYFSTHAIGEEALDVAAIAAFQAYKGASRTFPLSAFQTVAGTSVTAKLLEAGAIVREGDSAVFEHHLKHDYLAARFVATHKDEWNSAVFDVVTFRGSSFETVMMAMEQLPDSATADQFLRSLYDWNLYGAGYSIAEGRASKVSREMQLVILAMFAERQWDIFEATAEKARDTLSLIETADAREFLLQHSLPEVFAIINHQAEVAPWFDDWRKLFTKPIDAETPDADLELLKESDSVWGWTASNVFRRSALSDAQQGQVRDWIASGAATVRWRIAHVLGAFPSNENRDALVALLKDDDYLVRYGATRSLVEMAARSGVELAKSIFEDLLRHIEFIGSSDSVLKELERAVFVKPEPLDWVNIVAPVFLALQEGSSSSDEKDRWTRVLTRLIERYEV